MSWPRFLFVALPLALCALAAIAEAGAIALNGVSPRRNDFDRIVAALDSVKLDAPVVLAGDSVTQDVLKTHRIAPTVWLLHHKPRTTVCAPGIRASSKRRSDPAFPAP